MKDIIHRALSWRETQSSLKGLESLRLFNGASDGLTGLLMDRYGPLIVVSLYDSSLLKHQQELKKILKAKFPSTQVLFKIKEASSFRADDSDLKGREFHCRELNCEYLIKTDIQHDFGLFLDTHSSRQWLSQHAKDKQILNLFAYTCAFAVVGKRYGAKQVTNIDPNQDYLAWGKKNAELNQLDFRNFCDPAQKYLPRHLRRLNEKKDEPYDIVIADPPAFLVGRGDDRLGRKVWPKLLAWFVEMKPKQLILICNDRSFRKSRDLKNYFNSELNSKYKLKELQHRPDLLGQNPSSSELQDDYRPPDIFIGERLV